MKASLAHLLLVLVSLPMGCKPREVEGPPIVAEAAGELDDAGLAEIVALLQAYKTGLGG